MTHNPLERPQGPTLWVCIAGFAAAAVITLAAAVGTSMLHRQTPEQAKSFEAPVAQR
jgi:hypothetical protein